MSWHDLPTEMHLAILDVLDYEQVRALSTVDRTTYEACVPSLFKSVTLNTHDALEQFLENVPKDYCRYIQSIQVDLKRQDFNRSGRKERTNSLISLLQACLRLVALDVRNAGYLHPDILSCVLPSLRSLVLSHWDPEEMMPLSERLVVSFAASLPLLNHLSISGATRSTLHAPDLVGVYPPVPLVVGDSDIPAHPIFGNDLNLPSLLRLTGLRTLSIKDTHLGDARWDTEQVCCQLERVDLMGCCEEGWTERIMARVGRTVGEFGLSVPVKPASVKGLASLKKLRIGEYFPVDDVAETLGVFAGSPIERVEMECFEEDVVDVCTELEGWLRRRGEGLWQRLERVDVNVLESSDDDDEEEKKKEAMGKLMRICGELRVKSRISGQRNGKQRIFSENMRWPDGRVRANTV
ncbi:uncharacterized protein BT62DRAFT_931336 [Guyanagaster necrorhizus]|uniref:F-box domain-containing protein n=1 Tax=Guyanagaster necrorhizus TaxID=856835 RepID=A0A9P7VSQ1_9AGAR|nr:uncharacterized protein BT62DRAFT_931336 [Guyanagaster necrorhizus MCA 3950]KAG7446761.1 hypothetical protein BT62DRAFT_931336 [Guyanagaster necrorhizus MCA 3950]